MTRSRLDSLVELSIELGKALWIEKAMLDNLQVIKIWQQSIRMRLEPGTRLIRPTRDGEDITYSTDESVGVQLRHELGRLEKERQVILADVNRERHEMRRLRSEIRRLRRTLPAN